MSRKTIQWSGVFPAVTTQFNADFSLNLQATHKVMRSPVSYTHLTLPTIYSV